MIHNLSGQVLSNKKIAGSSHYLISIESHDITREARPGQFVMLGLLDRSGLFLRRPYSICGSKGTFQNMPDSSFQILYKVVGRGTQALSILRKGEEILILGPLGKGLTWEIPMKEKVMDYLIIAGGVGCAPFPLLIQALNRSKIKPIMLYGGKSRQDLPLRNWFQEHCRSLEVSTEDGSLGYQGLVSSLLRKYKPLGKEVQIYACGPQGMLKAIAKISKERGYQAFGSFEEKMACGFGACQGCALPIKEDGGMIFKHVCCDGPFFNMGKVLFE